MKFVIAAGGTGGHLFPGLAVGEVLLNRGHQVMLLISEKEIDSLATKGRSEFRIERLPGIGLPKLFSPAILGFLWRFRAGVARCRDLYRSFEPDAVLGMGGFTSTAPILAGRIRKIPAFVHESNAIPGKANRLNGQIAGRILLGLQDCAVHFPAGKTVVTGTPVRRSLVEKPERSAALAKFGFQPERKTLLVMGGSQGAQGLNRAVLDCVKTIASLPVQVIHLTGIADEAVARETYAQAGIPAFVAPFFHEMQYAYAAADLAIARSGAASLTELSYYAAPSILMPYPFAAEDHQTLNARVFERGGAAVMLPEKDATGDVLGNQITSLLQDPARLAEMSSRFAALAPSQAAERVADTILAYVQKGGTPETHP